MNIVDANIIIRFLTGDNRKKAGDCLALFEEAVKGKIELYISDLTIAEVVWVLEKAYKLKKSDIRSKIEAILNTPNLVFQNSGIMAGSILFYDLHDIDFIDAYHAALMANNDFECIYSYDKDFDLFENIKRKEP